MLDNSWKSDSQQADKSTQKAVPAYLLVKPWKIASSVEAKMVDWLWQGRIAKGMLNGLVGDGQSGKTSLLCKIIADLSEGRALPGQKALAPQVCWYVTAEDPI